MAEHVHVNPSVRINFWAGSLLYDLSTRYHAQANTPGPDQNLGEISNVNGDTVILPPVSSPDYQIQNTINYEAEAPRAGLTFGQSSRMILHSETPVQIPSDSPTSSEATAGIWNRGRVFAGRIRF